MNLSPTPEEKREFLNWIFKNFKLKKREAVWILNYINSSDEILKKAHFVEGASDCPIGLMIGTVGSPGAPFRFYKGTIVSADAEKAFHHIRLNQEDFYIEIRFAEKQRPIEFISVLEDNPFSPLYKETQKDDNSLASDIIRTSLFQREVKVLEEAIDKALDTGDNEQFKTLSLRYKDLMKNGNANFKEPKQDSIRVIVKK